MGSGWREFGIHLRKTIFPVSQYYGVQQRTTRIPAGVTEFFQQNPEGVENKGKELLSDFQILNPQSSRGGNSGFDKVCDGAVVTSVIKGAACSSGNTLPTLDISLRVEHGNEGKWHVISSKVIEVGPVAAKPSGDNELLSFKSVLTKGCGPRPNVAWKPKAQAGLHKALSHQPKLLHSSAKPTCFKSGATQPSVASHMVSSPTCITDVQLCKSSSQPSISDCHVSGIGSPLSACANSTFACGSSLSVPFQVVPGLGS